MSAKQIVGSTIEMIIKIVVFAFIIMFLYKAAVTAYDYGYRVFAEEPVSEGEGRIISVYVEENDSVSDIGQMLEEKGLIRDGRLFMIQELLSEHHGKIQPGIYDLNTAMTSQEMLAVMSETASEEDAESTEGGESLPGAVEAEEGQVQDDIEETAVPDEALIDDETKVPDTAVEE